MCEQQRGKQTLGEEQCIAVIICSEIKIRLRVCDASAGQTDFLCQDQTHKHAPNDLPFSIRNPFRWCVVPIFEETEKRLQASWVGMCVRFRIESGENNDGASARAPRRPSTSLKIARDPTLRPSTSIRPSTSNVNGDLQRIRWLSQ